VYHGVSGCFTSRDKLDVQEGLLQLFRDGSLPPQIPYYRGKKRNLFERPIPYGSLGWSHYFASGALKPPVSP
jgi:hypothetical protein